MANNVIKQCKTVDGKFTITGFKYRNPDGSTYWDVTIPCNGDDSDLLRVSGSEIRKIQLKIETGRSTPSETKIGDIAKLSAVADMALKRAISDWESEETGS